MAGPFYHADDANLGATIGQSLGTALFGNPQAAMQLQEAKQRMAYMNAEQANAQASAAHSNEETRGLTTQNDAAAGLPGMFHSFLQYNDAPPPPQAPPGADPLAPLPDAPPAPPAVVVHRSALPALIAAMAQAKGKDVNIGDTLDALTAYSGDDTLQRQGMIAAGHSPSKNFAGTAQRADDIAANAANADLTKATDVANIDNSGKLAVAGVESGDRRYSTNVESSDRRRGQDLEHGDRLYGDNLKADGGRIGGWTPRASAGGDNSDAAVNGKEALMSQRLGIGANQPIDPGHIPQVFDAIAASEGPGHNNNPGNIIDGPFAKSQPGYVGVDAGGKAIFNSPDAGRQAGIALLTTYFNRGQNTIQNIVEGMPAKAATAKTAAPKQVSAANYAMLFGKPAGAVSSAVPGELDKQIAARGLSLNPNTMSILRAGVLQRFQGGMDPATAVGATLDAAHQLALRQAGHTAAPVAAPAGNLSAERAQAQAAIANGAPAAQVKQLFQQRTGQAL